MRPMVFHVVFYYTVHVGTPENIVFPNCADSKEINISVTYGASFILILLLPEASALVTRHGFHTDKLYVCSEAVSHRILPINCSCIHNYCLVFISRLLFTIPL